MKKIAIVLFVVAAALAGCGKKKPPEAAAPAEGSAAPAEAGSGEAGGSAGDTGGSAGGGGM